MYIAIKLRQTLCPLAFALSCLGCHVQRIAFSTSLRQEHRLAAKELSQLQFYLSHDIVLRRSSIERAKKVETGKLLIRRRQLVREVAIGAGTAGVLVSKRDGCIGLSFSENTVLEFEPRAQPPMAARPGRSSAARGRFAKPPQDRTGTSSQTRKSRSLKPGQRYFLRAEGHQRPVKVRFAGELWEVDDASLVAHLLIDTRKLSDENLDRQKLRGLHID